MQWAEAAAADGRTGLGDGRPASIARLPPRVTELTVRGEPGAYSGPTDPNRGVPMKTVLVLALSAALAGCGVETASTAATAASLKKQELQQGQQTMQQAQQKIDSAMQQAQQRAANADK
jgi:hypothetical protein